MLKSWIMSILPGRKERCGMGTALIYFIDYQFIGATGRRDAAG